MTLFDIMKTFLAHAVFITGRRIEGLATLMESFKKPKASLSDKNRTKLVSYFRKTREGCEYLELQASVQGCHDLIDILKNKKRPAISGNVQSLLFELNKRISIELKAHTYLCVSRDKAGFLKTPLGEWGDTILAFPSTGYDIEEASKCLSLQRNTATVFHLMRVMGAGVTTLGKSLNEPTLDNSRNLTWDNVLRRCGRELEKEFKNMSPAWQADKQFYAAATTKLFAVKDAWRNPNAHEVGQKYTNEEALDIYRTVRSFMRQLATKLKE